MITSIKDAPTAPFRVISTKLAPPMEMVRWLFERYGIDYIEEAHAPVFFTLATNRLKLPKELPVATLPDGTAWCGIKGFLSELDKLTSSPNRLMGEDPAHRLRNWELVDIIYKNVFWQTVQTYYYYMIDHKALVIPPAIDGAPKFESQMVTHLYPLWKYIMIKGLDLPEFHPSKQFAMIDFAFNKIELEITKGKQFLDGDKPGTVDIVFSALAAPIIFPENFGATLPEFDKLPTEFQQVISSYRERPAGQLILATYDLARESEAMQQQFDDMAVAV